VSWTIRLDFVPVKRRARSGKGGRHYTPEATRTEEAVVALHGRRLLPQPIPGLWAVEIEIRRWRPWRKPGAWTAAKPREPDVDNVVKAVLDALNGIAWADDKAVVAVYPRSVCAEEVGCIITLHHLGAEDDDALPTPPTSAEFMSAVDAI
jgi:Holliday junction resolvase RusA-like endonuclease